MLRLIMYQAAKGQLWGSSCVDLEAVSNIADDGVSTLVCLGVEWRKRDNKRVAGRDF